MAQDKFNSLVSDDYITTLYKSNLQEKLASYMQSSLPSVSNSLVQAVSAITNIISVVVVVPFFLFYLLTDDDKFYKKFTDAVPSKYKEEILGILKEADRTLSSYIIGQGIIAVILGVLTYIGYLIIGLNYSFILAFFVMITSFIPMFGSVIGVIPALLVGLATDPFMCIKILIILIIVQQIEGNFISPLIIGKSLDMHPFTIIVLFLAAASQYGVIGMLIAIPTYAVLKVIFVGSMKIYKVWKSQRSNVIIN
jgi:predicted PurR-regulated permease PerM